MYEGLCEGWLLAFVLVLGVRVATGYHEHGSLPGWGHRSRSRGGSSDGGLGPGQSRATVQSDTAPLTNSCYTPPTTLTQQ